MYRDEKIIKQSLQNRAKSKATPQFALLRKEIFRTVAQTATPLLADALEIFDALLRSKNFKQVTADLEKLKNTFVKKLVAKLEIFPKQLAKQDIYPAYSLANEIAATANRLQSDIAAAFTRFELIRSLRPNEKLEIMRGMLLTRELDARLKKFFTGSEVKMPDGTPFQGKGFRSMGQEAIYAAGIRLRRNFEAESVEKYDGDFVTPMIRDLGLALAMGMKPFTAMAAQMGKCGIPTHGKDLHIGDFAKGVLPPAAPIGISTGTACGLGLALKGTGRVVISCIGDGGTSTGEWHEVVNFAAVQKMPVVFIVQNNQTALSTPAHEQFACSRLAQRAIGYGLRGITIDGTDAEAVFSAVTEAAEACRRGKGPVLVELLAMRMCGHAHHDDMLYFGHEPNQFLAYPEIKDGGYIDPEKYAFWRKKDPIDFYRNKLIEEKILTARQFEKMVGEVRSEIEAAAKEVIAAPWPDAEKACDPVVTDGSKITHIEPLKNRDFPFPAKVIWTSGELPGFEPNPKGKTFWQAIVEALEEELRRDPNTFILGEDVGGDYGNAFVILKSLLPEFGDRFLNTPLAESAIIGAATGAALLGKRPIAEIQFNDFVASGFNQLVNNTAKIFPRWQQPVPLTIRMPWGGLRQAGPYHSQNTEPWFYRTPGLKIVCPSTPREAKGLLKAAIRDDNPVLYYEHIALYRAANIKQDLPAAEEDFVLPIGKAHLKRIGSDLSMITYGAYVHKCVEVANKLTSDGVSCEVLDLRSILPLDKQAILATVQKTGRALIVHDDSKTGGIGQSVASIIAEEAFEYLDAPVRVLGALDAPVPYSPTLEEEFLTGMDQIMEAARLLIEY
jgi:2-oxoisovalerate dehydrogenase E1 component